MKGFKEVFKRVELKFMLSEEQYEAFTRRLEEENIAAPDEYGETPILNLYCDTPDDLLIRRSISKPKYKEKLRLRCYGVPGNDSTGFVEIKKKFRGVVYKRRIAIPYEAALEYLNGDKPLDDMYRRDFESDQIAREIDYFKSFYSELKPRMEISYDRIAYAGIADPELRITFDRNLRFRKDHMDLSYGEEGMRIIPEGSRLMELKIAGAIPLELVEILSDLKIYRISFSKYGTAYKTDHGATTQRRAA